MSSKITSVQRPLRIRLALCLAGLMLLVSTPALWAQWSSNRGYQLLQRVDDVLYGVDNFGLRILDRRYVAGTLVRVNATKPDPVRGSSLFVADCQPPLRLALVPDDMRGPPQPDKLEFTEVKTLDGSWAAAEFACESTRQPARAAMLARQIYERGGPPDLQTIYCELQPDGSEEMRSGVEVRYSQEANAVAVNGQWLSSGHVSATEVEFGTNSKWRIHRQALDVRRVNPQGEMIFSGACDRRRPQASASGSAGSGAVRPSSLPPSAPAVPRR